ncbi:MAG: Hpt domain-containing protein [Lachnospiraceae bacterium]|nr:Hpt domain-containing protein [Lachnospiraceae bacterium]
MGADITWLKEIGLDTEEGTGYTGGQEKYLSAVQRFYKNYEKNRGKVEEYLAAHDVESYTITVHSLKSNAKMIGAAELSKRFEALEMAGRNGETGIIDTETAPTLAAYAELIEKLSPVGAMGDVRAADEISAEVARETADRLLAALDDFDDDEAKKLAQKLSGYPFRMTQAGKLKEAAAFIEDFMYDEAAELIREIVPAIE